LPSCHVPYLADPANIASAKPTSDLDGPLSMPLMTWRSFILPEYCILVINPWIFISLRMIGYPGIPRKIVKIDRPRYSFSIPGLSIFAFRVLLWLGWLNALPFLSAIFFGICPLIG
jgi:hypothetical protein